jgi:hypothetical protein
MDRHTPEKKSFKPQPLSKILDLTEEKLQKVKGTYFDGVIVNPYETVIDRKSISKEDLIRYSLLRIECMMSFDNSGRMIFGTGKPSEAAFDYMHPEREPDRKGLKHLWDVFLQRPSLRDLKWEQDEIVMRFQSGLRPTMGILSGKFTTHQHPSGNRTLPPEDAVAVPLPSSNDIKSFLRSSSPFHLIFWRGGVMVVSRNEKPENDINAYGEKWKKDIQYLNRAGLKLSKITFDDEKFGLVLKLIRGDIEWNDAAKEVTS